MRLNFKDFYIDTDEHNFVLGKINVKGEESVNMGQEYDVAIGYYGTLGQALSRSVWNNIDFNNEEYCLVLKDLISKESKEIEYIETTYLPSNFKELLIEDYKDKYVIASESDKEAIKEVYGNVETTVVPEKIKQVVYNYQTQQTGVRVKVKSATELLEEFIERYEDSLNDDMLEDLNKILERI